MIPILGDDGKQLRNAETMRLRWEQTPADMELAECGNLAIDFCGEKYPVWKFMEMWLRIKDKEGHMRPFRLNSAQIFTYRFMDNQFGMNGYVRLNEAKARQMGGSTLIEGIFFSWMITHPGFAVGILADTEEKGRGLLDKYRKFYNNLPIEAQRGFKVGTDNADKFSIDFGHALESSVEVIVANENAGASKTFQALHCSEVALWPAIEDTIPVLEATVSLSKNTFIIRETTARGPNHWKTLYEVGKMATGSFRSIFLPWWRNDEYSARYDGHELSAYERKLVDLGVSLDQVQWWNRQFHDYGKDMRKMKQEYPSTEAEMWQTTSVSKFDASIIAKRKEEVYGKFVRKGDFEFEDPTTDGEVNGSIYLANPRFVPDEIGAVTVFEEPIQGHPYAISSDPAKQGDDDFAVVVMDCSNDKQVASYSQSRVDLDEAVYQSYCLWLYYANGGLKDGAKGVKEHKVNRVFVTGERNSTRLWLRMMGRLGAEPLSLDKAEDENGSYKAEYGWHTTATNRDSMLEEYAVRFRESGGAIINDYKTLCEMETFQYYKRTTNGPAKLQALQGNKDDLIMAIAGYFHCKARGDFECNIENPSTKLARTVDELEAMLGRKTKTDKKERFQEW